MATHPSTGPAGKGRAGYRSVAAGVISLTRPRGPGARSGLGSSRGRPAGSGRRRGGSSRSLRSGDTSACGPRSYKVFPGNRAVLDAEPPLDLLLEVRGLFRLREIAHQRYLATVL